MASSYTVAYTIRYNLPSVQQQVEAAVMRIADTIMNEEATAPDHANRLRWAQWAIVSSSVAGIAYFGWVVAFYPAVFASVTEDPSGASVKDQDISAAVEKAFPNALAAFIANPPSGTPTTTMI
jgi:hypothetical protein